MKQLNTTNGKPAGLLYVIADKNKLKNLGKQHPDKCNANHISKKKNIQIRLKVRSVMDYEQEILNLNLKKLYFVYCSSL